MREMTMDEIDSVGGAVDWGVVAAGAGIVALGAGILATGGLALVPLGVMGAATFGEFVLVGSAMAAGAAGGYAMGEGFQQ
jgi:hypothetical protein